VSANLPSMSAWPGAQRLRRAHADVQTVHQEDVLARGQAATEKKCTRTSADGQRMAAGSGSPCHLDLVRGGPGRRLEG